MQRHTFKMTGIVSAAALLALSLAALNADPQPATQPIALAPATQAAPTTAPALADVGQLIRQLGSDNPDERDVAQKQLVEMGPSVVPALKKAAENDDDPEIRTRASAALAQMKDHADNDVSLITLHKTDVPAQEVLDEIAQQAHCQFLGNGAGGLAPNIATRNLTIDADQKPFWDVLSDACTQLNVCPVLDTPGHNAMRLFPQNRNWIVQSPHHVVGPYWVGVAGLYRTRTIDLMGPENVDDQFSIQLIIYPEPKLAVTQMSELKLLEATDDAGNSLLPRLLGPGMSAMFRSARQGTHMVQSRLTYPKQPGKTIAILRGEVTALLGQDLQLYQVDDVLGTPKVTNPLTHCTVKFNVLRQGTEMYRVSMECTRDGLTDEKWAAMVNRMGDMSLEDADGHALTPLGMVMVNATSDTTFTGTCLFSRNAAGLPMLRAGAIAAVVPPAQPPVGEPKVLKWNVATSVKPVTIPVLFKDLPMP